MAHSVEGRFPFLDYQLVDFANKLPSTHKLFALDEKHLLKRACTDLIPSSILERPKQPYRAPDASAFFSNGSFEWIQELTSDRMLKKYRLFNPKNVQHLISKCRKMKGLRMSNTDNMRIVCVLSTMLIYQQFIEGDGRFFSEKNPPEPLTVIDKRQNP
jgi:asparagine synthase (glutamine-hydrolysing)